MTGTAGATTAGVRAPVILARADMSAVPPGGAWLTSTEESVLLGLRVAKRARDWRLGRWVAKEVVRRALGAPELRNADIEILAASGGGPEARVLGPGNWPEVSLSLSHAGGFGLAAAVRGAVRLGCDVEVVSPRSDAFVQDYFTHPESAWILASPGERDFRANLLWSAKESALKALGQGLRADTRSVEVDVGRLDGQVPEGRGWSELHVGSADGTGLGGAWYAGCGCVWTLMADAPLDAPSTHDLFGDNP